MIMLDLTAIPKISVDHVLEIVHQTGILPLGQPGRIIDYYLHNPVHDPLRKDEGMFHKPQNIALSPEAMLELQRAFRDSYGNPLLFTSF